MCIYIYIYTYVYVACGNTYAAAEVYLNRPCFSMYVNDSCMDMYVQTRVRVRVRVRVPCVISSPPLTTPLLNPPCQGF